MRMTVKDGILYEQVAAHEWYTRQKKYETRLLK
jgi:hypothetical protein